MTTARPDQDDARPGLVADLPPARRSAPRAFSNWNAGAIWRQASSSRRLRSIIRRPWRRCIATISAPAPTSVLS